MIELLANTLGALFGGLGVIFGAFGAHTLKKRATEQQLTSFETGVRYQFYHAIVLLVLGTNFSFQVSIETYIIYAFIVGTFLFSFSIYGLVLSDMKGKKWKFLGPITPLGGLILVVGWSLLLYSFIRNIV